MFILFVSAIAGAITLGGVWIATREAKKIKFTNPAPLNQGTLPDN